ncbi:MAG: DUF3810 domain-containing protein [Firmicutes bacterium]|nr:DUF3810 domain-containing protein [Bacillota bacterium]
MISLPFVIESLYSTKIYKCINSPLSLLTGLFPFSVAEALVFILLLLSLYKLFVFIKNAYLSPKKYLNRRHLFKTTKRFLLIIIIFFIIFEIIWGLNYYRLPFSHIIKVEITKYSKSDLEELCMFLIEETNKYRENINENKDGVMTLTKGKRWVLSSAYLGYNTLSNSYNILSGKYGKPKPVLLSNLMCYTGIVGIYFPFTGEANVNMKTPDPSFPNTVAHEMAHQRGYAREDEANFISYLACIENPNIEFKYSGSLLALTYSINALYKEDKESADSLKTHFSEGLAKDLIYIGSFWEKYEGPVERITNDINDTYLKANSQKDGVKSYGRMVDLLIAYYKKNK